MNRRLQARSSPRPVRALRLETLESRWVFSAVGLDVVPMPETTCGPEPVLVEAPMPAMIAEPLVEAAAPLGPAYPARVDLNLQLDADQGAMSQALPYERPSQAEGEAAAPVLLSFSSQFANGYWTFFGRVDYTDPVSLQIKFGGLLAGEMTYADSTGYFQITRAFDAGTSGGVSAQAYTFQGQGSNQEWAYVS